MIVGRERSLAGCRMIAEQRESTPVVALYQAEAERQEKYHCFWKLPMTASIYENGICD